MIHYHDPKHWNPNHATIDAQRRFWKIVAIISLGAAILMGIAWATGVKAQVVPPILWRPNYASSTIAPITASLKVPCANIVGGCGGGGSSTSLFAGDSIGVTASGTNGYIISNKGVTSTAGNWTGTWQVKNPSDFLSSSTVVNTPSTTIPTNDNQLTNGAGYITSASATTTVNGVQSSTFYIIGDGTTVSTTVSGATTTFRSLVTSSSLGVFTNTNQLTNGANFIILSSLSGVAPITYNNGTGAFGFNTSTAMSLSGLYTFLGGGTFNSTATFNSSTIYNATSVFAANISTTIASALYSSNASGILTAYAGSSCTVGSLVTSISALGGVSCNTTSSILAGYSTSTGSNPTASAGLSAVNGTSNFFMRADAAPQIDQTIAPTWTGIHTFSAATTFNATTTHASSTFFGGLINVSGTTSLATTTIRNHLGFTTSSVSLTNCGTNTISGSDNGGAITYGQATTTCTLNFAQAWNYMPACTLTLASGTLAGGSSGVGFSIVSTTLASIRSAAAIATTSILQYICQGNPN